MNNLTVHSPICIRISEMHILPIRCIILYVQQARDIFIIMKIDISEP